MKSGKSSLNPHAESYVPLSRRGAADETKDSIDNERTWLGFYSQDTRQNHLQRKMDDSAMKVHTGHGSYGSSSRNPSEITEKRILEEFEMDLAFLQMTYPGISDDSISEVYLANKGDLEATLDMLSQLELYAGDSFENLPDSLDIGDVSEPGSSSEAASQKLKNVAGEVGSSSFN